MATLMTDEDFAAMAAYAAQHGRKWKERISQAWLNDWREQWGALRSIRNNPHYAGTTGFAGIFATYDRTRKAKAKEVQA